MKRIGIVTIIMALILGLWNLPSAVAQVKTLTIGVDQEAIGLDPNIVTSFSSMRRIDLLYNKLVRHDENLKIVPDLAESWEVPDNLTYIFNLRRGVRFHDGSEFTAQDVEFTLNRIIDPKTASPGRAFLANVKSVEVLSPYRVKVTLSSPLASLLEGLAHNNCSMVSKEAVAEKDFRRRIPASFGV